MKKRIWLGTILAAAAIAFANPATIYGAEEVSNPVFSVDSQFSEGNLSVEISTSTEGATIYYTTDGSDPVVGENTTYTYSNAIAVTDRNGEDNVYSEKEGMMFPQSEKYPTYCKPDGTVSKATIIRAIAVDAQGNTSNIVTKSYFVGAYDYGTLPVISVVTDPDNLFDYTNGIYTTGKFFDDFKASDDYITYKDSIWKWVANFTQKGSTWERSASMTLFEDNGQEEKKEALSQEIGIRIQGNTTRIYNQKGLNLYAREVNGATSKKFKYSLFPNNTAKATGTAITTYRNFTLRAGGDDTERTKTKDVWQQNLFTDRAFLTQASRPCVLFLDGEYWGIYYMTEKYSESMIANHYGVDKDDVVIIKDGELDSDPLIDVGDDKNTAEYKLYSNFLYSVGVKDMTVQANYDKWLSMVDLQSFMDYYGAEIILGNRDWPYGNELLWRTRTTSEQDYYDGKWRWGMFDTDDTLGQQVNDTDYSGSDASKNYTWDAFARARKGNQMFDCVMKNDGFRYEFLNNLKEMYLNNYQKEEGLAKFETAIAKISPYMKENFARFSTRSTNQSTSSLYQSAFLDRVEQYKTRFAQRVDYLPSYFESYFGVSSFATQGKCQITVKNNLGTKTIRGNSMDSVVELNRSYETNVPIRIQAEAVTGYTFSNWSVSGAGSVANSTSADTTLTCTADTTVTAIYVKAAEPTPTPGSVNGNTNTNGTNPTTTTTKPAKVSGVKLKNLTGKKVKVTWKKITNVKGYEIFYSLNKKFKKATKKTTTKNNLTIKKLKLGKKYYVRVRAYKVANGKKIYGTYSGSKNIKIKK